MAPSPDLKKIHDDLIDLARRAGQQITSATPTTTSSGSKKNTADLVTETDRAVEAFVSSSLRSLYPDYSFMGEETYKPGDRLTDAPTFIVDPIDGTTNFVHNYPYVSISLGFAVERNPLVGVVYNPYTDTLYSAISGQGAFKNQSLRLPLKGPDSPTKRELEPLNSLSEALVALEWGSDRSGPDYVTKINTFAKLCRSKDEGGAMVHGVRSLGSAALNFCGVAEGSLDIYWEGGCWAWDVCAGWVVLKEAGGTIVDGNPGSWEVDVDARRYLAARKGVSKEVIEEFWSCVDGKVSYAP